jgi:hypothetical protein
MIASARKVTFWAVIDLSREAFTANDCKVVALKMNPAFPRMQEIPRLVASESFNVK